MVVLLIAEMISLPERVSLQLIAFELSPSELAWQIAVQSPPG